MVTYQGNRTVFFDVDDTLIEWKECDPNDELAVSIKKNGYTFFKREIRAHTTELKLQRKTGNTVVVWSAGGADWAASAIEALGLKEYVDVCLTKPDFYYDDKDVKDWFPKKRFYHEEVDEKK